MECKHEKIVCINPYETIRKYRCQDCNGIMMCACDEYIATTFLAHQITEGCELETQKRIKVDLGFQPDICEKCRGIPETAFPRAEIYGRSSKIHRYYWREITYESYLRLGKWADENNISKENVIFTHNDILKNIEIDVVEEIKLLHETNPKYHYNELSQQEIIDKYNVEIVPLHAEILKPKNRKVLLKYKDKEITAEEFAKAHYSELGYNCMETESIPFHVLFGTFLFLLIQDNKDSELRLSMFGSRTIWEQNKSKQIIRTFLPNDFGSKGYSIRRKKDIEEYFLTLPTEQSEILWTFEYWLPHSNDLREYLWAHKIKHIEIARNLLSILPIKTIYSLLRYLIDDYWGRYIGWPDMIIYNSNEYFFAEVKASKDKLSEDQKRWIKDNYEIMHLPFKIVKIHKMNKAV